MTTRDTLLLITRTYPPVIGGMEKYSYDLYRSLSSQMSVELLANTRGKPHLPWFACRVAWFLLVKSRRFARFHFADGALSPFAWLTRALTGKPVTITIHALDITFDNWLYQFVVPKCVAALDAVVCVSTYTREECIRRGIAREKCRVITNGLYFDDTPASRVASRDVEERLALPALGSRRVLFTVGRTIKRKGHAWFIGEVMAKLPDEYVYVVAGDGPEKDTVLAAIGAGGLEDRVYYVGRVSEDEKLALMAASDYFVMPNVPVAGDAEGFGITLLEAAAVGLPAIAARLEGITDAVVDGVTGRLVESGDSAAWVEAIMASGFERDAVRDAARAAYDWSHLVDAYLDLFGSPRPREGRGG